MVGAQGTQSVNRKLAVWTSSHLSDGAGAKRNPQEYCSPPLQVLSAASRVSATCCIHPNPEAPHQRARRGRRGFPCRLGPCGSPWSASGSHQWEAGHFSRHPWFPSLFLSRPHSRLPWRDVRFLRESVPWPEPQGSRKASGYLLCGMYSQPPGWNLAE